MIGTILIKDDFKLSAEFKWRWSCGPVWAFLLLVGAVSWIRYCRACLACAVFQSRRVSPQGQNYKLYSAKSIPFTFAMFGALLQVIRFLSSICHCGSSVYVKKTNVSAAGNINTH